MDTITMVTIMVFVLAYIVKVIADIYFKCQKLRYERVLMKAWIKELHRIVRTIEENL